MRLLILGAGSATGKWKKANVTYRQRGELIYIVLNGDCLKVNAVKTAMCNAARGQISRRNPRKMTLNMTHGNGAAVVVRARESLVHGEGRQFTILIQNKERCVRH